MLDLCQQGADCLWKPLANKTKAKLSLRVVQMGGIGFVHYNMTIKEQVQHVIRAKQHQAGLSALPEVLAQESTVADILALKVMKHE